MNTAIQRAAEAIADADAIFIGAGAGMGVDSGLPDFRGNLGFWRAYPPFRDLGLSFAELANPRWFADDPSLAWGFYGHRLHLYRDTEPHDGFALLKKWGLAKRNGAFVFTSNVDGQFQRAGYDDDAICECHGSIHHLQCAKPCEHEIWRADETNVAVDDRFRASEPFPVCSRCNEVARPNILMFGDGQWLEARSAEQSERMKGFLDASRDGKVVVIELGAGTAVPTVRWQCERVSSVYDAQLIRINPRVPEGPDDTISIVHGALETLQSIDALL